MVKSHRTSKEMVSMKNQKKVSRSTPEQNENSPSRDSDSMCDSDASSPVPFICTQDGAEGETDVVWNFYTPKSGNTAKSRLKNSTPYSRRTKRAVETKIIEKHLPKRRTMKLPQKKTELFKELIELNQNLHDLITKKTQNNCTEKVNSESEDDIFNESPECSPKSRFRGNSICLRRNVLSSNFAKTDPDAALESDDSLNECLIKASQIVEENINNKIIENNRNKKSNLSFKIDQDSMDAILNSIKLDSPAISNGKKCASPNLKNDSFDSFVGNLNDSALDKLTQIPVKMDITKTEQNSNIKKGGSSWSIKEFVMHDSSPSSKSVFGRHSSMPESPTVININKPSTSGMVFGRYNSLPLGKDSELLKEPGDSPITCTPEEIKKKHRLAREKLMAKRLLPFTPTQKLMQKVYTQSSEMTRQAVPNRHYEVPSVSKKQESVTRKFQPRLPSTITNPQSNPIYESELKPSSNSIDIKSIIEIKRQEALMKLRRRHIRSKMI